MITDIELLNGDVYHHYIILFLLKSEWTMVKARGFGDVIWHASQSDRVNTHAG